MKKYENFCKALDNLHEGAELKEPYTLVERTGIIALFQICFEQAWKLMKAVLEEHGATEQKISSPKGIIKLAYQWNMINDQEKWLELLEVRNILAHTYSDENSFEVIQRLKTDLIPLFDSLKENISDNWTE